MIIKQIRLKNIKSFGDGPDGNGVLIQFDRGLNRIGGKNGAGKSSIIEALGYALFDAEPIRGDNRIQVGTYLVREGARTGSIDVWLETPDGLYRVERDAGKMERRWKVVREDDGYTEAEGNDEVKRMLARLFGVSGPERLDEFFHSLIGVKQGRFTAYFDCRPSEAKAHFDPLLDVDIFRACFENLLEPLKLVQKRQAEIEKAISEYQGGMTQLQDAPEQMALCERNLAQVKAELENITVVVEQYRLKLDSHEKARQRRTVAEQKYIEAQGALQHAQALRANAEKEMAEAEQAVQITLSALSGFQAYQDAEQSLKALETQRLQRDRLQKDESALHVQIERHRAEKAQRQESVKTLQQDIESKQGEGSRRRVEVQNRLAVYQTLVAEVEAQEKQYQTVGEMLDCVKEWRLLLNEQQKRFESELAAMMELSKEAAAFNPNAAGIAEGRYQEALKAESEAKEALVRADQEEKQLAKQLESIRDGVCPLLGERCHQFNPERIRTQLDVLAKQRATLQARYEAAAAAVNEAKALLETARSEQTRLEQIRHGIERGNDVLRQCYQNLENTGARQAAEELERIWPGFDLPEISVSTAAVSGNEDWQRLQSEIKRLAEILQANLDLWVREHQKLGQKYQENLARQEQEKAWISQEKNALKQLGDDILRLQKRVDEETGRIAALDQTLAGLNQKLAEVRQALAGYPDIESRMQALQLQKDRNEADYRLYLQYQPIAEKQNERQKQLGRAENSVNQAERNLSLAAAEWEEARKGFDETTYQKDNEQFKQALERQGQVRAEVERAEDELNRQQERMRQLTALERQCRQAREELDRMNAQSMLLEKARTVLKNAQGLVAAGLAKRIGNRAQAIYNSMSPEPAQFEWDASDYKLTIRNASGERRFTQLSGGQQMKAAIAMQLALVKEFSKVGICAFDEPTYGLDVESRRMLADAIAAVYKECRFDQLFVVSHDETFDDKVEHVINLKYSPTKGTMVEME